MAKNLSLPVIDTFANVDYNQIVQIETLKGEAMSRESTMHQRQVWLIFFFLGCIMLNFPFIQIFNRFDSILGLPLLVLYLLVGWPLSIIVIYLFSRSLQETAPNDSEDSPDMEVD